MGVNHGGTSPPEFGVGTLMQIAPPPDSCFKILNTRLLALQCSKKLIIPIILTEYSLFPKSTSSTSTKSPLRAENIYQVLSDSTGSSAAAVLDEFMSTNRRSRERL